MADATLTDARPRRQEPQLSAVPYLPGLDGMRAIAVVAVMIYHANAEWLAGGFLGVEVFFVISGYLITLLLMAEREQAGRVDLVAFWGRRARRLLPALFVMLFLLLTYTAFFRADELGKLRGDLVASLLYVSNWYQIWVGQGYTSVNDFVPLRHLWSLAVEEQFYLLWPVVMMLLLRRGGTRRLALTARWLVITALAVTVLVALLYHPGRVIDCEATPEAYWQVADRCINKTDALYLSTITRSSGLLLGAAFAMVWRPRAIMRGPLRNRARVLDLAALVGLAILGVQTWFVHVTNTAGGGDAWLYRGGFLITAIGTLLMIAGVTHRLTLTSRVLAMRPLLWVGTRSYGLYLYHWPIYQIIRKVAGNPLTFPQFAFAMVVTGVLTEASYRLIETPIRRRRFLSSIDDLRYRAAGSARLVLNAGVVVCVLLLAVGVIRLGLAEVKQNAVAESIEEGEANNVSIDAILNPGGTAEGATQPEATTPPATTLPTVPGSQPGSSTTSTTTTTTTTTTLPSGPINYLAIGDSVMLGSAGVLTERGYTVNAEVSRQMIDMVPVMQQLAEAGVFDNVVVIHLGTNGPFEKETLDAFLEPLSSVPNVILLNVHANRSWTASNNQLLADRDRPGDNIILIDWNSLATQCPGSCFADDGIHLNATGMEYYADVIGDVTAR